jgi:3-hydroxy-3-methylglutaryl CoA synthase
LKKGLSVSDTSASFGLTGFGGHVPRLRMQRSAIAAAHQWMAPALRSLGKGRRAFCSWDEDSVTMAVEAARDALDGRERGGLRALTLASTTMPFADLQNSSIVAAALDLPSELQTLDIGHAQRAGVAGLLAALRSAGEPTLFIASDRPRGKPASTQEMGYGAGAAAFTLGHDKVIASLLGAASRSALFIDHFRATGEKYDYFWEERWIRDEGYLKLVPETAQAALADAGIQASEVKHFILAAPFKGMADAVAKKIGIAADAVVGALEENCGFAGCAHGLLMLAHRLEVAQPGDVLVLVGFGQGCDVLVLRATEALQEFKPRRGVSGALADAQSHESYLRMLSYDDAIDLEWGMRAEKQVKTALTEQYRSGEQLSSFTAAKCRACGTAQFPPLPYCANPACKAPRSQFEPLQLFDQPAKVLTFTGDWLSFHPAPPLYVGFVQFDNGARLLMEMVDVGIAGLEVGQALRMTYRIKDVDKSRNYPRYFWKATPLAA